MPLVTGVYIGLGSNLDDPPEQIRRAARALAAHPGISLKNRSSLYRSAPMDGTLQPEYCNAVVEVESALDPFGLLTVCQSIERDQGRTRGIHWGPRTLDLDLLVFADQRIATERLIVPHPGLAERAFVLYPLLELAPDLDVPGVGLVSDLVARCGSHPLECTPFADSETR